MLTNAHECCPGRRVDEPTPRAKQRWVVVARPKFPAFAQLPRRHKFSGGERERQTHVLPRGAPPPPDVTPRGKAPGTMYSIHYDPEARTGNASFFSSLDDRKRGCLVGDPRAMRRRGKVKNRRGGGEGRKPQAPYPWRLEAGAARRMGGNAPTRREFSAHLQTGWS